MANKSTHDSPDKPTADTRKDQAKAIDKPKISIAEMIARLNSLPAPPDIEQRDRREPDDHV
jgi:hypothetical protein